MLFVIRQEIISFYRASLAEPHASLVAGVVLGSKSEVPESFWNALKASGTAHVVVASGMNVTLVAGFLVSFLILFVPRYKACVFALLGIWLYAVLCGFDAPIIRAAIMGSIAFVAVALGKLSFAWRGLIISAVVMLIIKPQWIFDLGFILSFAATASLMVFGNAFRSLIEKLRLPKAIGEGLYTSLAAQIFVLPILYFTFGYVSIWSPIINMLVLWTIPYITVLGMIAAIIALIFSPLAVPILYLAYPLTSWFMLVINHAG
jgi:competence protein ComEC